LHLKTIAIEPKSISLFQEYIQINENLQKEERSMEISSRIEYETDAIKDQNSTLELQNRSIYAP
jgi:hypothetical protein